MASNNFVTVQPAASPVESQRVEVSIEARGETEQVVLRYSTWTEGLGWCCQKTIRLDNDQLDDIHRALMLARQRIKRRQAEAGQVQESARVIQLPTIA
jgi:hypothetical protein